MAVVEKLEYKGWRDSYRISNGKVELVALSDVGPRIIRYGFAGEMNQFVEFPEHSGLVGGEDWRIYGGHRLWHSPEDFARTYYPDNNHVDAIVDENSLKLIQLEEPSTRAQKSMEIEMDDKTGDVIVFHTIKNNNLWNIKLSAWAISAMAPGGLSILKQRTLPPDNMCLPNLRISIWAHTSIGDSRVIWGDEYILLKQEENVQKSFKTGVLCDAGWLAYVNNYSLFVKYYEFDCKAEYPDYGSSVEIFTCSRFSEIETLSPLVELAPGAEIRHREVWKLFKIDKTINELLDEDALNSYIAPLIYSVKPVSVIKQDCKGIQ